MSISAEVAQEVIATHQVLARVEAEGGLPTWFAELKSAVQGLQAAAAEATGSEVRELLHFWSNCGESGCQHPQCEQNPNRVCFACRAPGPSHSWSNEEQRIMCS